MTVGLHGAALNAALTIAFWAFILVVCDAWRRGQTYSYLPAAEHAAIPVGSHFPPHRG